MKNIVLNITLERGEKNEKSGQGEQGEQGEHGFEWFVAVIRLALYTLESQTDRVRAV
jgi:hypothetical protein